MIYIKIGDCREVLKSLPDNFVHGIVTSPPYYRLRRYLPPDHPDKDKEIGQEQTPEDYIHNLVEIFREVKRVLRDDGTLFINIKDCYDKNNELRGIPWKLAFALKDDGWKLIQEIIWEKPNCLPESVTKRCTSSHESIFLFAKSKKYYFDHEAIKEPLTRPEEGLRKTPAVFGGRDKFTQAKEQSRLHSGNPYLGTSDGKRNKRSVWHISTVAYKAAHFACFPPKLAENCLKAGTSEKGVCSVCGSPFKRVIEKTGEFQRRWSTNNADGSPYNKQGSLQNVYQTVDWQPSCSCDADISPAMVLDPFGGSGTVGQVCNQLGRDAVLIELNPEYKHLIEERINIKPTIKKQSKKRNEANHLSKVALQQNLLHYIN
jgi:site-specific DNA-methyltransferase (adenine-specific)